jgi:hypothetical protein
LLCCGGGVLWWYASGGTSGVTPADKAVIMQQMNMNREAGYENEPVYVLWDGIQAIDAIGEKVKLVRVKFYQRKNPNQVFDKIAELRNGRQDAWVNNPFGDDWKAKLGKFPDLPVQPAKR